MSQIFLCDLWPLFRYLHSVPALASGATITDKNDHTAFTHYLDEILKKINLRVESSVTKKLAVRKIFSRITKSYLAAISLPNS
jgi:hypothetical protein